MSNRCARKCRGERTLSLSLSFLSLWRVPIIPKIIPESSSGGLLARPGAIKSHKMDENFVVVVVVVVKTKKDVIWKKTLNIFFVSM